MNYFNRNKSYYVDGNERKDVINTRWKFVKKYLKNELRMYRWIQIPLKEAIIINIDSGGYKYVLPEYC